jgi:hypothetical protein
MHHRALFIVMMTTTLAGCSIDPYASWAPDAMKDRAPASPVAEAPPDIRALLRTNLAEFFLPQAAATEISFSTPRRTSLDWTVCIRATVNGATGGSIGQQTYLFNIERNQVARQAHVAPPHWCEQESYQRI